MVPYVDAVDDMTVMHVLLFCRMCVCCENVRRGVGAGVLSSACDVLEMSVVRGVVGVCDMCMCLARRGWDVFEVSG